MLTESMQRRLTDLELRRVKVTGMLTDPAVIGDQNKYRSLSRELRELDPVVEAWGRYQKAMKSVQDLQAMIRTETDRDMRQLAQDELTGAIETADRLEEDLKAALIPRDKEDSHPAIVEIRAGTGGDEAGLFAADLFRMYTRYAERRGWKIDIVDIGYTGLNGLKEVVFGLDGDGVYGTMKFESGVHRVQRVPKTEASGRIHTSAATVAVLPEVDEVDIDINPADVRTDVFRASGSGGQNVNKVETAIRLTHIPTGVVVSCQDENSQIKNKEKAWKVLRARLYEQALADQQARIAAERKSLVSTGDRSAKIRTYNFPQGRVTDHRIGLTLYSLQDFMDGHIDDMLNALKLQERTEKLQAELQG